MSLQLELTTRIDAYAAAKAALDQNAEARMMSRNFDPRRYAEAEQKAKWIKGQYDIARENLCGYVLEHRAEFEGQADGNTP